MSRLVITVSAASQFSAMAARDSLLFVISPEPGYWGLRPNGEQRLGLNFRGDFKTDKKSFRVINYIVTNPFALNVNGT